MGIAGLVIGIISIVICWVPFLGFCLAGLGIIFSAKGLSKNKQDGRATGGISNFDYRRCLKCFYNDCSCSRNI